MDSSAQRNIIITGAGGLIGPLLAQRLLEDPQNRLFLTDVVEPVVPKGFEDSKKVVSIKCDLSDPAAVDKLLEAAKPLSAVFIFHGIMSAGSEADFDLSYKINVQSVHNLLLALRRTSPGVRVIYSSSQAVYGQPLPDIITDDVTPTPEGTYGSHKLLNEIFINDMHRKGFIDAFILRFPTVVVRPGLPSNAAPSFLSGMIREPMKGQECVIPLTDRSYKSYLCSPSSLQENLIRVLNMPSDKLPPHIRHINFPGVAGSTQELMDALAEYGGEDKLKFLREETKPELERILRSWPLDFDSTTPVQKLGLVKDERPGDLVKEYIDSLKDSKV